MLPGNQKTSRNDARENSQIKGGTTTYSPLLAYQRFNNHVYDREVESPWYHSAIHLAHCNTSGAFTLKSPPTPSCTPSMGSSEAAEKAGLQGNSPWGLSPAAAYGVGCVFSWPLPGHCDKNGTGLQQKEAVESQTDTGMVSPEQGHRNWGTGQGFPGWGCR